MIREPNRGFTLFARNKQNVLLRFDCATAKECIESFDTTHNRKGWRLELVNKNFLTLRIIKKGYR